MNETVTPDIQQFRDQLFKGVVGQVNPKKEFNFYLDGYYARRMVPHMAIIAPKGQGKTKIARAFAKGLYQYDKQGELMWGYYKVDADGKPNWVSCPKDAIVAGKIIKPKKKPLVEVNCSSLRKGGVKGFINSILVKYVVDKDVTVFFDEASEIPHDVSMALLTILEPNATNRTQYVFDEYVCDFDFRRQSFIFATTESQKVFHALLDRCERITLQEYSLKDLADIVQIHAPAITFEAGLLDEIATVLRGNARAAQKMSEKILSYLRGRTHFTRDMWKDLKGILSIHPLGLNAIEIQVLRFLRERPNGTSLTRLSAKSGMSRAQIQQDSELYLAKYDLMEITTTGRNITTRGLDYLKEVEAQQPVCVTA